MALLPTNTMQTQMTDVDTQLTFSILRCGATEPGGPYTEEQILAMLNDGHISKKDYVFFDGLNDWRPIEKVFEIHEEINHLVDDGQDKAKLSEAFQVVSNVLAQGEEIYYIAVQLKAGMLTKTRQSIVITNFHLFHLFEKRAGYEMEAHRWDSVTDYAVDAEKNDSGTFSFRLNHERRVDVSGIPGEQNSRLQDLCREMTA